MNNFPPQVLPFNDSSFRKSKIIHSVFLWKDESRRLLTETSRQREKEPVNVKNGKNVSQTDEDPPHQRKEVREHHAGRCFSHITSHRICAYAQYNTYVRHNYRLQDPPVHISSVDSATAGRNVSIYYAFPCVFLWIKTKIKTYYKYINEKLIINKSECTNLYFIILSASELGRIGY